MGSQASTLVDNDCYIDTDKFMITNEDKIISALLEEKENLLRSFMSNNELMQKMLKNNSDLMNKYSDNIILYYNNIDNFNTLENDSIEDSNILIIQEYNNNTDIIEGYRKNCSRYNKKIKVIKECNNLFDLKHSKIQYIINTTKISNISNDQQMSIDRECYNIYNINIMIHRHMDTLHMNLSPK
jgi:hypothetical protein